MPYAESAGARIYWEEHGAGDPLLLIQGLGYTIEMWFRVLGPLAAKYRVIVFDNRGVGRSDVTPGPYLVPMMVADTAAVLDAAGVDSAHVLGISLGGLYAQELALTHPDRVRSLVLAATFAPGPSIALASPEFYAKEAARRQMSAEQSVRAILEYTYDPETPAERVEEDIRVRLANFPSLEGYNAQVGWVGTFESEARVGAITAPTLVLHGETDRFVVPENGRNLARFIPGAKLVMVPHASHLMFTDQPEFTVATILEFLASVPRPAGAPAS
jgi:pimeloyl-ACP methyl ester carboxylesterase